MSLDDFELKEFYKETIDDIMSGDDVLLYSNWWTKFLFGIEQSNDKRLLSKYFRGEL